MGQRIYFEEDGNYTYIVTANKQKKSISMNLSHKEEAFAAQLIRWNQDVLYLSQIILTPLWHDIDEFTRLKKAINGSNLNNSVTTVYTIDEDGKNVDVHCKSVILFVSQIPDLEEYLRIELNEFFRAHQYIGNEMAKLREKEETVKS